VLIAIYFFIRGKPDQNIVSPEFNPINNYVLNCLNKVGADAIEHIGETGGYFEASQLSNNQDIAYYFYNRENKIPSKNKIENELEKYIDTMLFFCIKNFKELEGYEIRQGEVESEVKIEENKVSFDIIYPLNIKKGDKTISLDKFQISIDVRLGTIYRVLNQFMEIQMEEKDLICMSCINHLAESNNLLINMQSRDGKEVIFYVIDTESEINEAAYWFKFVNKYD